MARLCGPGMPDDCSCTLDGTSLNVNLAKLNKVELTSLALVASVGTCIAMSSYADAPCNVH
eukprot:scaffold122277_cov29-Prasinocladus_malaysianus.AAC.1